MTNRLFAALLLALPLPLAAQEGEAGRGDPQAEYRALSKGLNEAMRAWRENVDKQLEAAQEAGQPPPAIDMAPPTREFVLQAQELADKYAGTDDAVRFLLFVVKNASNERNAVRKAVDDLVAGHSRSPAIGDAVRYLPMATRFIGPQRTLDVLDIVIGDNEDQLVLAKAHVVRGRFRLEQAKTDADRAAAKQDLLEVGKLTEDEELRNEAAGVLFEIEHLQVGCTVPEVEGKDTDGVAFKLSDYRGKVVMLDFWGFWWGPCRAMIPHERSLVEKYKDKPFALLGVNSDRDLEQYRKLAAEEGVTWRSFWDESTSGPIATRWNIQGWPTIYLIDHRGVIRHRDIYGEEEIDKAIEALVDEAQQHGR